MIDEKFIKELAQNLAHVQKRLKQVKERVANIKNPTHHAKSTIDYWEHQEIYFEDMLELSNYYTKKIEKLEEFIDFSSKPF